MDQIINLLRVANTNKKSGKLEPGWCDPLLCKMITYSDFIIDCKKNGKDCNREKALLTLWLEVESLEGRLEKNRIDHFNKVFYTFQVKNDIEKEEFRIHAFSIMQELIEN